MKNRALALTLSLALLCLCALAACGVEAPSMADLTPTSELVIYNPYYSIRGSVINSAIARFKERYPDVEVKTELFRIDLFNPAPLLVEQYKTRMSTELLAGEGPDVVFLDPQYFDNIDKLASGGFLEDLNPYFEADADFDISKYYAPIFDSGLNDGKRVFVPYHFRLPSYVSSEERLQAAGIDPASVTDIVSLLEEAGKALPALNQNPGFKGLFTPGRAGVGVGPPLPDLPIYERMLTMVGSALARREEGREAMDSGALRAFFTALKPCYQYAHQRYGEITIDPTENLEAQFHPAILHVLNGEFLFASGENSAAIVHNTRVLQEGVAYSHEYVVDGAGQTTVEWVEIPGSQTAPETPVHLSFSGPSGAVQAIISNALAINQGGTNKANAYRFIKILIDSSYEVKTFENVDKISKEPNLINMSGYVDIHKLSPEAGLPADQVTEALLENPMVAGILTDCMMPFLMDRQDYESCETALRERLNMYWGE